MSDPNQPETEPADLRGPGDPDAAPNEQPQPQPHPEAGTAGNIREEQMTQAAGTVPAAYVGPEDEQAGGKPEDAAAEGTWDDEV
ncbi:hypothetical protein QWJ39_03625 [Arthrobacter sp. YD4]|uniref:hypothetical protein n=1 Tax=Arthrobacter sp. YD4 TaxID=3058043 RepID=UPI0025B303C9|nr:hypothetical protein [Arthrobacter sp. YD4]MDN3935405.1 hypothetical protein [Arthrobacter sp. YD4]